MELSCLTRVFPSLRPDLNLDCITDMSVYFITSLRGRENGSLPFMATARGEGFTISFLVLV